MITVRKPDEIYQAHGRIQDGTFDGRWHFSFDRYHDPEYVRFGSLRVFNDDTLSPGAVWPLHPHREIEVVTYCAGGEFRHADQRGAGGVLRKGWVQHTTVGTGMLHSEINNRPDEPMRFIQMWFLPSRYGLEPSVEQRAVERPERTNRLVRLVAPEGDDALPIRSSAEVWSSFLEAGQGVEHSPTPGHGIYLYVVEGGPVRANGETVPPLGAAQIRDEPSLRIEAQGNAELLLIDVGPVGAEEA
jgi:redox-sensitive bicupin YhaK (pirin superfamily)